MSLYHSRYIPTSPHNDRVQKIQEKLNSIEIGVAQERYKKFEQAESHLSLLEDQFIEVQGDFDKSLNGIRENLIRFEKVLHEERINQDSQTQQSNQQLAQIESKFNHAIESEAEARREYETKVVRALDDKYSTLKGDISRETLQRNTFIDDLYQSLQQDLPKIESAIEQEKGERVENDEGIMKTITAEITKINDSIGSQKKQRETSEGAIFDILKDIVSRVKVELDGEKRTREETEERLLGLLEDATSKIHVASQF